MTRQLPAKAKGERRNGFRGRGEGKRGKEEEGD